MVPQTFPFDSRRRAWRIGLLLAALVVALQGLAAALLAASGPLHVHQPLASVVSAAALARVHVSEAVDRPALVDFRRALPSVAGTAAPHRHDGDDGEDASRHHHADADTTRLALDDPAARGAAEAPADDARAAQPAFLPLPSGAPRVAVAVAGAHAARPAAEDWRTLAPAPPERPPRLG